MRRAPFFLLLAACLAGSAHAQGAIAGSGPGSLAEYQTPGHVDTPLIDDIATWIKAH